MIFTFASFLTPPSKDRLSTTKTMSSPNLVSVLLKLHVSVWLSFKTNPKFDQKWWFCPTHVWRFLSACFLTPHSKGCLSTTKRDLFTKLGLLLKPYVNVWWDSNKSKNLTSEMVILPHPRIWRFYRFRLLFNSSLKGPSLENEERSLHQTWSVCYWSPMSMFGWVWNKSKIWPKMVILPHPRYGDFYWIRLLFNSSLKGPSLENEERSLHQTWSVCYWSPMSMFGWVSNKSKNFSKMVILSHPRYGNFYWIRLLLTPPSKGRLSRTKERSVPQTWSVCYWSPMSMFAWVSNKSKFHPKWWFCPTRGMAIFTAF